MSTPINGWYVCELCGWTSRIPLEMFGVHSCGTPVEVQVAAIENKAQSEKQHRDRREAIDSPMTVHIRQLAGLSDVRVFAHRGRIDDVIEAFTTHCEMNGQTVSAKRIDATGPPTQIDGASYEVRYMSRSGKERVWTHTFLRSDPMWFSDEGELLW